MKAFVLGAGFGTRLKKITSELPKVLIRFGNRILLTYAFEHLQSVNVNTFIVNTHYKSEKFNIFFPNIDKINLKNYSSNYNDSTIHFINEPQILDTGGGIKNVQKYFNTEDFLVYNGDIISDLPLDKLIDHHNNSNSLITLALRSKGKSLQINLDKSTGHITNIFKENKKQCYQFTGIYIISPKAFDHFPDRSIFSIIEVFDTLISKKLLQGVVIDEGIWADLGTIDSYLKNHTDILINTHFPIYKKTKNSHNRILTKITDEKNTSIDKNSFIGKSVTIEKNVTIKNSIIWDGAIIKNNTKLENCILLGNHFDPTFKSKIIKGDFKNQII